MAATVATYCPSRMVEHPKSKSTQPRFATRWVTLYMMSAKFSDFPVLNLFFVCTGLSSWLLKSIPIPDRCQPEGRRGPEGPGAVQDHLRRRHQQEEHQDVRGGLLQPPGHLLPGQTFSNSMSQGCSSHKIVFEQLIRLLQYSTFHYPCCPLVYRVSHPIVREISSCFVLGVPLPCLGSI